MLGHILLFHMGVFSCTRESLAKRFEHEDL